jgi:Alpha-mannosidase
MKKVLVVLFMFFSLSTFAQQKTGTVYMVSNAHFDTQWNWTVQTSISEYLRNTINQNLKLFEMYPDYVFNFEGGVKYNWMKEYYPLQFEKVKEYVKTEDGILVVHPGMQLTRICPHQNHFSVISFWVSSFINRNSE